MPGQAAHFDIVIPCHEKDVATLPLAVAQARRNLRAARNIFVVSEDLPATGNVNASWISERVPLWDIDSLRAAWEATATGAAKSRLGWLYQQLLKLGADLYIQGLSADFLCLDADLFFLRDVPFIDGEKRFMYVKASQYHAPYLATYRRLMCEDAPAGFSFIADHMMFNSAVLADLRAHIEKIHSKPWWAAILDSLDYAEMSSFSEFDLYGNWILCRRPELAEHRPLKWESIRYVPTAEQLGELASRLDFAVAHAYLRAGVSA